MDAMIIPNFVLVDRHYQGLPGILVNDVSGFAGSPEYAAISTGQRHHPETVCAALVQLCLRLQRRHMKGRLERGEHLTLAQTYQAFEQIASGGEVSRKHALVTAMFAALERDWDWTVLPRLKVRFGPHTRKLLDTWMM